MRLHRSIIAPPRPTSNWDQRWGTTEQQLITCWERGREKAREEVPLADEAKKGRLVLLPWKGGVEKPLKAKTKYGTVHYLAMWQGLRGEDLDIDPCVDREVTCALTGVTVIFTADSAKYANVT